MKVPWCQRNSMDHHRSNRDKIETHCLTIERCVVHPYLAETAELIVELQIYHSEPLDIICDPQSLGLYTESFPTRCACRNWYGRRLQCP